MIVGAGYTFDVGALLEECEEVFAVLEKCGVVEDCFAIARSGKSDLENLTNAGLWPVRHHDAAVGHEDGFIDAMSNNHGGDFFACETVDDDVLEFHAR